MRQRGVYSYELKKRLRAPRLRKRNAITDSISWHWWLCSFGRGGVWEQDELCPKNSRTRKWEGCVRCPQKARTLVRHGVDPCILWSPLPQTWKDQNGSGFVSPVVSWTADSHHLIVSDSGGRGNVRHPRSLHIFSNMTLFASSLSRPLRSAMPSSMSWRPRI